jgi:hypothetical protein
MEYWSDGVLECSGIGVLRHVRIAPRVRGVGDACCGSLIRAFVRER